MSRLKRAYLLNVILLGLAFSLSVAVGAVAIPPGTLARLFIRVLPGSMIPQGLAHIFDTIVFQIRLPHTVLIALAAILFQGMKASRSRPADVLRHE